MKILKSILSVFLIVLCVLSVLGFVWWGHPPDPLAASATGGRFILVLTLVGCLVGLWRLWAKDKASTA
jgi:hypothetical protein